MLDGLWRTIFPPKCVLCGKILESEETDLCKCCRIDSPVCADFSRKRMFLDSWTAVWYYEAAVRNSILRFKFRGARGNADCYGRMLAMKLSETHPEGFDVLTWVPTATLRRLRRGYDQSKLIAEAVGRELEMEPVRLLRKKRNNPPQSGITGQAERRANVLGVYGVTDADALKGKRILLLDDIITTGATAGECARMLLTAGAEEVHCGAVAVTRPRRKTK